MDRRVIICLVVDPNDDGLDTGIDFPLIDDRLDVPLDSGLDDGPGCALDGDPDSRALFGAIIVEVRSSFTDFSTSSFSVAILWCSKVHISFSISMFFEN